MRQCECCEHIEENLRNRIDLLLHSIANSKASYYDIHAEGASTWPFKGTKKQLLERIRGNINDKYEELEELRQQYKNLVGHQYTNRYDLKMIDLNHRLARGS